MKLILSRAAHTSSILSLLLSVELLYPTRQRMRQTKKIVPGAIPSASGLRYEREKESQDEHANTVVAEHFNDNQTMHTHTGVSARSVPRLPRSLPQIPLRNVYCCRSKARAKKSDSESEQSEKDSRTMLSVSDRFIHPCKRPKCLPSTKKVTTTTVST